MMANANAFLDLTVLRRDAFAVQQPDGRYLRIDRAITEADAQEHLDGTSTLLAYANHWALCLWGAGDADYTGGLFDLQRMAFTLRGHGLFFLIERSRREGHGWLLCREPVAAVHMRRLLIGVCRACGVPIKGRGQDFGVELRPAHDEVQPDRYGLGMRLPLGVHRLTGERYPLVDGLSLEPLSPVPDVGAELAFLVLAQRATAEQIARAAEAFPDHREAPRQRNNVTPIDTSSVDVLQWAEQLTTLRRVGNEHVGLCPFHTETEGSFRVYPDGHFYCFGCGTWGDSADLKAKALGVPLADVLREVRRAR